MSGDLGTDLYFVLVGRVGKDTVWPCSAARPAGWQVAFGPDTRQRCEQFVRERSRQRVG